MTLGGLKEGVTPLEMAYAYSTIANKGVRVSGSLASSRGRPGRDREGRAAAATRRRERERKTSGCSPTAVGETAQELLAGRRPGRHRQGRADRRVRRRQDRHHRELRRRLVRRLQQGADGGRLGRLPGQAAADEDRVRAASPVAGGTYPTEIWHDFMTRVDRHPRAARSPRTASDDDEGETPAPLPGDRHARPSRATPARRRTPAPEEPPSGDQAPHERRAARRAGADARPLRRRSPGHAGSRADAATPAPAGRRRPGRRRRSRLAAAAVAAAATAATRAAARVAEAPRQLHGLGDADPLARPRSAAAGASRRGRISIGPSERRCRSGRARCPSAWVSLPGPEQRSCEPLEPAARAHQRRCPRAARARGSAPPRPRPRLGRPR